MLNDAKEISAVIAAIASLCVAIIVWIRTVSVQRKIHEQWLLVALSFVIKSSERK